MNVPRRPVTGWRAVRVMAAMMAARSRPGPRSSAATPDTKAVACELQMSSAWSRPYPQRTASALVARRTADSTLSPQAGARAAGGRDRELVNLDGEVGVDGVLLASVGGAGSPPSCRCRPITAVRAGVAAGGAGGPADAEVDHLGAPLDAMSTALATAPAGPTRRASRTRSGMTQASGATPTIPVPLSAAAAMAALGVPWPL